MAGVITAGALWTPLWRDDQVNDDSILNIISQIRSLVGDTGAHSVHVHSSSSGSDQDDAGEYKYAVDEATEELFSMDEMREELERLRREIESGSSKPEPIEPTLVGGSCILPAAVPEIPMGMRVTQQMTTLVDTVISEDSRLRVAFWGPGGVGKTTLSAYVCRQQVVRQHFEQIVWVSLGQSPVLSTQQGLMYRQLTGKSFNTDLSQDEKNETLKRELVGKHVLVVVDDCWNKEHQSWFLFLDTETKSRALISSRVRDVIADADIVDIGVPPEQDCIHIVMSAAGLASSTANIPTGAKQVVAMCKRLPLTLGIAGRLIADMGLAADNWSDAVDLISQELYAGGDSSAGRATDSIIETSLKAIQGPHADSIRVLLRAFGLIPEDCQCPLEFLSWAMEAELGGTQPAPSVINLRRWVKSLIDRSLVLPPVDRPSLHDLVLDFAVGQHSVQQLRTAHRTLVGMIRERRPGKPSRDAGMQHDGADHQTIRVKHGWTDSLILDDRLCFYIVENLPHHIKEAWEPEWDQDEEMIELLDDFPGQHDAVCLSAAEFLGAEKCTALAQKSEDRHEWWQASCRHSAIAVHCKHTSGHSSSRGHFVAAAAAINTMKQPTIAIAQLQKDRLHISILHAILQLWNANDIPLYRERCAALISTEAASESPEMLEQIIMMVEFYPMFLDTSVWPDERAPKIHQGSAALKSIKPLYDASLSLSPGSIDRTVWLSVRRHMAYQLQCHTFSV